MLSKILLYRFSTQLRKIRISAHGKDIYILVKQMQSQTAVAVKFSIKNEWVGF